MKFITTPEGLRIPERPEDLQRLMTEMLVRGLTHENQQMFESQVFGLFGIEVLEKALERQAPGLELVTLPLDQGVAQWLLDKCGVDPAYAARIPPDQLRTPGYMVTLPEPHAPLLVDGHHRAYQLCRLGCQFMTAIRFPEEVSRESRFFPGEDDSIWP